MSCADNIDQPELSINEGLEEPHKKRKRSTMWDLPVVAESWGGSSQVVGDSRRGGDGRPSPSGLGPYVSSSAFLPFDPTGKTIQASEGTAADFEKNRAGLEATALSEGQRRAACRLYVGSLHYDVRESDIRAIFTPFGTISNIDMSFDQATGKSKGYCFVEFAELESTQRALDTMNGFNLAGRQLRVGRPSDKATAGSGGPAELGVTVPMVPGSQAAESLAQAAAVAHDVNSFFQAQAQAQNFQLASLRKTGGSAKGQCTRIYVGAVAFEINAEVLQRVFEPFGAIRKCQLLPDNSVPGKHRGYGFIEYEDERAAVAAIERMNGFMLLGRKLRVSWASNPNATPVMNGAASAPQPSMDDTTIKDALQRIQQRPPSPISSRRHSESRPVPLTELSGDVSDTSDASGGSSRGSISWTMGHISRFQVMSGSSAEETLTWRCILLTNLVSPQEADDPGLMSEILEEAKKFGKVEETHLHKVGNPRTRECVDVRIFVMYNSASEARNALQNFRNRLFGGKKVSCELYDHNLYRQRRFQFADG